MPSDLGTSEHPPIPESSRPARPPANRPTKLNNLRYWSYSVLFVIAAIVLVPYLIDPTSLEKFCSHFYVVILTRSFCQVKPQVCATSLDPRFIELNSLLVKEFDNVDMIYVRHRTIEKWDNFWIALVNFVVPKRVVFWTFKKIFRSNMEREFFWSKCNETLELFLAAGNSAISHTLKGVVISRAWVFFIFGFCITIVESWARILEPLAKIFDEASVF